VIYAIVKRLAERAPVDAHPHSLRAAFAVQFDEQKPGHVIALKELLGHSRIETTMVYLRRKDEARAMEEVRDLSWGALRPSVGVLPASHNPNHAIVAGTSLKLELHHARRPCDRDKQSAFRASEGGAA
jgi:hypothetical protein